MDRIPELQNLLKDILGSENVYFQPPETVHIEYPCFIYVLNNINTTRADNNLYLFRNCYSVTVIDKDPDSDLPRRLLKLPLCSFDRFYTADNLNHWVFSLYF